MIWTAAIASFQQRGDTQDALVYDEPEPLPFSAFHWLGAALLEAKRFADAEKAYRDRAQGSPAQWLVAARPEAGARGQGSDRRGRCRSDVELVALGHMDPVVALLSASECVSGQSCSA